MYVAVWFCVAPEEEQAPTLLNLVRFILFYKWYEAEAGISSSIMHFSLKIVCNIDLQKRQF